MREYLNKRDGVPWLQSETCKSGRQHCSICPEIRCGDNTTDLTLFAARLRELQIEEKDRARDARAEANEAARVAREKKDVG